jgi:KaiC/GvpD/RAD55 family RecA-like ATPase
MSNIYPLHGTAARGLTYADDPRAVFDGRGEIVCAPRDLKEFAELVTHGWIRRFEAGEKVTGTHRHWTLAFDATEIVPIGLRDKCILKWLEKWRERKSAIRGAELCVYAAPGRYPAFVTWLEEPYDASEAHAWISRSGFEPIYPGTPWQLVPRMNYPFEILGPGIYLAPSAEYRRTLPKPSELVVKAANRLVTGLDALDSQFRAGRGIPAGARVVIKGPPSAAKTTLALEIAEAAISCGYTVVWLALDEGSQRITARRLQRRGLAPDVAQTLPDAELAKLDEHAFYTPDGGKLEDVWELAHEIAEGRPLLMVGDSLQKLRASAAEDKGERERIDAVIDAVQECQRKWPATFLATSEQARRSGEAKGSVGIDYGATLALSLSRSGAKVSVQVTKNRDGSENPFALTLDDVRQRMTDPSCAPDLETGGRVWKEICAALDQHGPELSGRGLETWVTAKASAVRQVIREHVEQGDLVRKGTKYRRPDLDT